MMENKNLRFSLSPPFSKEFSNFPNIKLHQRKTSKLQIYRKTQKYTRRNISSSSHTVRFVSLKFYPGYVCADILPSWFEITCYHRSMIYVVKVFWAYSVWTISATMAQRRFAIDNRWRIVTFSSFDLDDNFIPLRKKFPFPWFSQFFHHPTRKGIV